MSTVFSVESEWLGALSKRQPKAAELLSRNPEEQQRLGYFHTLREICQQPATWLQTSGLMLASAAKLQSKLHGTSSVTLTGSGSSEYAGDCVRSVLQAELGLNQNFHLVSVLRAEPETPSVIDALETYLRYDDQKGDIGWSVKAGAFFPTISLENDDLGWTSPYTLTPSAINSWIGDELRTIGSEGRRR